MLSRCYDLHCHSNQSDGILSPEALVSRAKAQDVSVLALTDHDTINGLDAARAQAEREGIELVNGIEFSCLWANRNIHVVALAFDPDNAQLVQAINGQGELRTRRGAIIAERLEGLGLKNALAEAEKHAQGATLGRPHFAKAMVEAGLVSSVDQAFKRYLGAGKPGDIKQMWPEFGDIVEVINAAGGVAILAHPLKYKMTRTKLCQMLEDFIDSGGRAMEVVSGTQRPDETRDMAKIANKYQLLASCGSDFHSPAMQWNDLGRHSAMPESVTPVWTHWEAE